MNYYEKHLGDYARSTAHLSLLEHGIYNILLDWYYVTEKGIPKNSAHRIARAKTRQEIRAVDAVLAEFFTLVDDVFINHRAEGEVAKALSRIKAAQENGKRGGRPKKNPKGAENQPPGFPVGFENGTQPKTHQTPDSTLRSPDTNKQTYANNSSHHELASRVCVELREMGLMHVNSQHSDLLMLIGNGVDVQEFISAGAIAIQKNKSFAYALGIVKSRIQEKQNNKEKTNATTKQKPATSKADSEFVKKYACIG